MKYLSDAALDALERLTLRLVWQFRIDQQRAFEPLGISPMQAFALMSVREGIEQPSSLAFVLDVSPSGVSQLLAGLEERGWVRRELDSKDRRQVRILLTEEGRAFLERLRKSWREVWRERYSRLSSKEIEMLCKSYRKLLEPQAVKE
ncbi:MULTISPECIES: MarR family winged helix-turn-helix transcriptional regulator [unclassified Meiothermus]|jgi:DNA-binding MarR family transcriptional regulator|uniref:MarR family winged helix-turn-helix transcriptional regulator n=1 Tax=unclassified Meiothermus TaxID=370471 RepID=UPI001F342CEA|nr:MULTISPECIES: winged helix DNA-binding protein [unclassified Meiothermus]